MTIERYNYCDTSWDGCTGMWEDEEGDYVKYSDHLAYVAMLKAEIAELKAGIRETSKIIKYFEDGIITVNLADLKQNLLQLSSPSQPEKPE